MSDRGLTGALTLLLIVYAAFTYGGSNAWRLGPPLGEREGVDFEAFMTAARAVRAHHDPYAQALRFASQPSLREYHDNGTGFVYPPLFAVALLPFTSWSDHAVSTAWVDLSFCLLLVTAALIVAALAPDEGWRFAPRFGLVAALMFAHYPAQADLKLGQCDILLLFLLVASFWLFRKGSPASGLLLALVVAVKPFLIVMTVFLAWKKDWAALATTLLTSLVLFALGFTVAGWSYLPSWMAVTAMFSRGGYLAVPDNQSASALATRLFSDNFVANPLLASATAAWLLPLLVGGFAVAVWLAVVRFGGRRSAGVEAGEFSLTLLLAILTSPFVGVWHLTWVLLPLAALLCCTVSVSTARRQWLWAPASLLCALYLGAPQVYQLCWRVGRRALELGHPVDASALSQVMLSMYLCGLIGLFLVLAGWLVDQRADGGLSTEASGRPAA